MLRLLQAKEKTVLGQILEPSDMAWTEILKIWWIEFFLWKTNGTSIVKIQKNRYIDSPLGKSSLPLWLMIGVCFTHYTAEVRLFDLHHCNGFGYLYALLAFCGVNQSSFSLLSKVKGMSTSPNSCFCWRLRRQAPLYDDVRPDKVLGKLSK